MMSNSSHNVLALLSCCAKLTTMCFINLSFIISIPLYELHCLLFRICAISIHNIQ